MVYYSIQFVCSVEYRQHFQPHSVFGAHKEYIVVALGCFVLYILNGNILMNYVPVVFSETSVLLM